MLSSSLHLLLVLFNKIVQVASQILTTLKSPKKWLGVLEHLTLIFNYIFWHIFISDMYVRIPQNTCLVHMPSFLILPKRKKKISILKYSSAFTILFLPHISHNLSTLSHIYILPNHLTSNYISQVLINIYKA